MSETTIYKFGGDRITIQDLAKQLIPYIKA